MPKKQIKEKRESDVKPIKKNVVGVLGKLQTPLSFVNVVIQGLILIFIIKYTTATWRLVEETRKETNTLKNQFDTTSKPLLYVGRANADLYLKYKTEEITISEKEKDLRRTEIPKVLNKTILAPREYLIIENVSSNLALSIRTFYYNNEDNRLYGSLQFENYIKPNRYAVVLINDDCTDENKLEYILNEYYGQRDTDKILRAGFLKTNETASYYATIYRDISGRTFFTKTPFVFIKGTSSIFLLKPEIRLIE